MLISRTFNPTFTIKILRANDLVSMVVKAGNSLAIAILINSAIAARFTQNDWTH